MLSAQIDYLTKEQPLVTLEAMDEEGAKNLAGFCVWTMQQGKKKVGPQHTCFVTVEIQITCEPLENFGDKNKVIHKVFLTKLE
ncbi:MAG: hypothetical protein HYT98_02095 [Candidatus Sungbacteria bacterium]|nr:hypothetical protein [Candidatus Sungbacteria bacterium]